MPALASPPLAGNAFSELRLSLQSATPHGMLPLDGGVIDQALGGGLAIGSLHEFRGCGLDTEFATAPTAFVLPLLARLAPALPIFWVARACELYAPGLMSAGLNPDRLVQLRAGSDDEALACAETLLRAGIAAAVVCEAGHLGKLASRRLQLACQRRATTGFLLRRFPYGAGQARPLPALSAVTRWQITAAPSAPILDEPGETRLRVSLLHARGGRAGEWLIEPQEGQDAPHPFRLAATLADPPQDAPWSVAV